VICQQFVASRTRPREHGQQKKGLGGSVSMNPKSIGEGDGQMLASFAVFVCFKARPADGDGGMKMNSRE